MFQYRQALARMRQGDSDRDIARDRLMGRKKLKQVRAASLERGWLDGATPLPDDGLKKGSYPEVSPPFTR